MPTWLPGMPGISKAGMPSRHVGDLDLDLLVVELAGAQPLAEGLAGGRAAALAPTSASMTRSSAFELRLGLDFLALRVAHEADADLEQVADDLIDVAADIADLGELGGLDLDEGRIGELGEAAGDLGLADAGRADHQDVLGQDLLAHLAFELLAAPAVAERDRHGALRVALADDVAVELGDDLAGRSQS